MVLSDPYAAELRESWLKCAAFWRDVPPGQIHNDDTFGVLTADYLGNQVFEAHYAGYDVRLYPADGAYDIRLPNEVSNVPEDYIRSRIAFVFLRLLCGCVHLHAGGIATEDGVIGLLAQSHVGKSTLTGACLAADASTRFVSDDVLTILCEAQKPWKTVLPSAVQLAMRHEMWDGEDFVLARRKVMIKTYLEISEARRMMGMERLKALVLLEPGDGQIERLAGCAAVPFLIRQLFSFSNTPDGMRRYQFGCAMSLLNAVPVYRMGISLKTRESALASALRLLEAVRKS